MNCSILWRIFLFVSAVQFVLYASCCLPLCCFWLWYLSNGTVGTQFMDRVKLLLHSKELLVRWKESVNLANKLLNTHEIYIWCMFISVMGCLHCTARLHGMSFKCSRVAYTCSKNKLQPVSRYLNTFKLTLNAFDFLVSDTYRYRCIYCICIWNRASRYWCAHNLHA